MDAQTFKAEATKGINDVRQVVYDTVHSGCEAREVMTQGIASADASAAGVVLAAKGEEVIDKWSKGAGVIKEAAVATGNYVKDAAVATGHLAKEAIFGVPPEESPISLSAAGAAHSGYCDNVRCHNLKPCAQHSNRTAEAMQGIRDATHVVYDKLHTGCEARDAMTQGTPAADASAASAVLSGKGEAVMGKWSDGAEKIKEAASATGNYVKDTAVATGHLMKEMAVGGARRVDEVAHTAGAHIKDAAHNTEVKVKDAASAATGKLRDALPRSKDDTCDCTADSCKCDSTCKCMRERCMCSCSTAAMTSNIPTSPLHTPTATISH
jgi:hypothetical protein